MASTVIGVFNDYNRAQEVARELVNSGFRQDDVRVTENYGGSQQSAGTTQTSTADNDSGVMGSISNFFGSLFGSNTDDYTDIGQYTDAVRQGNTAVAVHADNDAVAERAADIMNTHGAIDINGGAPQTTAPGGATLATTQATSQTMAAAAGEATLPVIEEELQVGKRAVQRGAVRIHSRITETPIEESVRLREEHVTVERRPVDRPVGDVDFDALRQGEIVVTETQEVPVVAKQARVVEEVMVNKEVVERAETIRDTVRRTDVEVEQVDVDRTSDRS